MLISNKLLLKLITVAHFDLKYKPIKTEDHYTLALKNLIQVRNLIYYQANSRMVRYFNWDEPQNWKKIAKNANLKLTEIETFRLLYGKHKNKTYATGFSIPYQPESKINIQNLQTNIDTLFASHPIKRIRNQRIKLYLDSNSHHVIMIIPHELNLKEPVKNEEISFKKSSTL